MKKVTSLLVVACLFMTALTFAQGVTTSAIDGRVLENNGEPLPGATVVAVHQPQELSMVP
jgi:hypothetical protein